VYGFRPPTRSAAEALTEQAVYGLPELNGDRIPPRPWSQTRDAMPPRSFSVWRSAAAILWTATAESFRFKSGVSGAGRNPHRAPTSFRYR